MTASAADQHLTITAYPSPQREGAVEILITRRGILADLAPRIAEQYRRAGGGDLPADYPATVTLAELTVPACEPWQARELAEAWLRTTRQELGGAQPRFEWGAPTVIASTTSVHHYATTRRRMRRRWGVLRRA